MKRLLAVSLLALPALFVTGCPMYPDECESRSDCALGYACDLSSGECVLADDNRPTPDVPTRCLDASDCRSGQICDEFQRCVSDPSSGGSSGESSSGGSAGDGSGGEAAASGSAGDSGATSNGGASGEGGAGTTAGAAGVD